MNAILQDDGILLVPVAACAAAERIGPEDPRYATLRTDSAVAAELNGTPQEDADLAARWNATTRPASLAARKALAVRY